MPGRQQLNYFLSQRKQLTPGYNLIMEFSPFILVSQQINVNDLMNDSWCWTHDQLCGIMWSKKDHNEPHQKHHDYLSGQNPFKKVDISSQIPATSKRALHSKALMKTHTHLRVYDVL